MKHLSSFLILLLSFLPCMNASLNFGNQQSSFVVHDGVRVHLNHDTPVVGGTLDIGEHATMTGEVFVCDDTTHTRGIGNSVRTVGLRRGGNEWEFTGAHALLDGGGDTFDLERCKISIDRGTHLCMQDLYLKGLSGDQESLIFKSGDSKLSLDNVILELSESFTLREGTICIENPTTFVVGPHSFFVDAEARLIVDGTVLMIETLDADGFLLASETAGNLTLLNSGTVRYAHMQQSSLEQTINIDNTVIRNQSESHELTEKPLTKSVNLKGSVHIHPGERIDIRENITINGKGATVIFSHPRRPQFCVADGKTVRLTNIDLVRVNAQTFKLGRGSTLEIGEKVTFEMCEDITFRDERIRLICTRTPFALRGMNGTHTLNFVGTRVSNPQILDLNDGMLKLCNIRLTGLRHIPQNHAKSITSGTICLAGNSTVVLDRSSVLSFLIESENNCLEFAKNSVALRGRLSFQDEGANHLHIRFAFPRKGEALPQVILGDDALCLRSKKGSAHLVFDDPVACVYNEGARSFVLEENAVLDGNYVYVCNYPIINSGAHTRLSRNIIIQAEDGKPLDAIARTNPEKMSREKLIRKMIGESYDEDFFDEDDEIEPKASDTIKRFDAIYYHQADVRDIHGTILVHNTGVSNRAFLSNCSFDFEKPADIILRDGACISFINDDVLLKQNDCISAVGQGKNSLIISNHLRVAGKLNIEPGSTLELCFDESAADPRITFQADVQLTIPENSQLIIRGNGTVYFDESSTIQFCGHRPSKSKLICTQGATIKVRGNELTCAGIGGIHVTRGGSIHVKDGGKLFIGTQENDSFVLKVSESGALRVDARQTPKNDEFSWISFSRAAFDVSFEQGGVLAVGHNGRIEFNTRLGEHTGACGILKKLSFAAHGILNIAKNGKCIIGMNRVQKSGLDVGHETPFVWDNVGSLMYGEGDIQVAPLPIEFPLQARWVHDSAMTSDRLFEVLTQQRALDRTPRAQLLDHEE